MHKGCLKGLQSSLAIGLGKTHSGFFRNHSEFLRLKMGALLSQSCDILGPLLSSLQENRGKFPQESSSVFINKSIGVRQ